MVNVNRFDIGSATNVVNHVPVNYQQDGWEGVGVSACTNMNTNLLTEQLEEAHPS